jgi:hypothetical protein
MTRKDLEGTSRAEYLFSAAPTTTRQTTDCAPNGGSARGYQEQFVPLANPNHGLAGGRPGRMFMHR